MHLMLVLIVFAYFLKDLRSQLKMWLYCKELDLKTKTAF